MKIFISLITIVPILIIASCSNKKVNSTTNISTSSSPSSAVSFSTQIMPIVKSKCLMCHKVYSPYQRKPLLTNHTEITANLAGIEHAILIKKNMPPANKEPLTLLEQTLLKSWISQGAKNN